MKQEQALTAEKSKAHLSPTEEGGSSDTPPAAHDTWLKDYQLLKHFYFVLLYQKELIFYTLRH